MTTIRHASNAPFLTARNDKTSTYIATIHGTPTELHAQLVALEIRCAALGVAVRWTSS